jgi:hypothetical protein
VHYGNIASVLGLFLSVATLLVALSVRNKVKAAEEKVLLRAKAIFYHGMLADAARDVKGCRDACDQLRWELAIERCRNAHEALLEIARSNCLRGGDAMLVKRTIDDLAIAKETLHKKRAKANRPLQLIIKLDNVIAAIVQFKAAVLFDLLEKHE